MNYAANRTLFRPVTGGHSPLDRRSGTTPRIAPTPREAAIRPIPSYWDRRGVRHRDEGQTDRLQTRASGLDPPLQDRPQTLLPRG